MPLLIQALPHKPILLENTREAMGKALPMVSVFDRSFLYGDSLYEVARTQGRGILMLKEHLARLRESARLCLFSPETLPDLHFLESECIKAYRQWLLAWDKKFPGQMAQAYFRIIYSRGTTQIGFSRTQVIDGPKVFFIILPLPPLKSEAQMIVQGLKLKTVSRLRNSPQALDPAMKSGNYLNSLLAFLEATQEKNKFEENKFEDALLCNAHGHITEGTTFNIFYIKRGIVVTSPLEIGILDGITRSLTLECAKNLGLPVRVTRFGPDRLHEADEVFITSTTKDVYPVTQLDHIKYHLKPDCLTLKLRKAVIETYEKNTEAYTYA